MALVGILVFLLTVCRPAGSLPGSALANASSVVNGFNASEGYCSVSLKDIAALKTDTLFTMTCANKDEPSDSVTIHRCVPGYACQALSIPESQPGNP